MVFSWFAFCLDIPIGNSLLSLADYSSSNSSSSDEDSGEDEKREKEED